MRESTVIIRPKSAWWKIDFKELWLYRELFYFFAWRDFKVRYKQALFGAGWAIFQPLISMVVFTVFFGKLAKMPSDGIPYPIFVYAGLIFWTFFSTSLTSASNCMVSNENIIKKIYFPRLILPFSVVIVTFVDFIFAAIILCGFMIYYKYVPSLFGLALLPVLVLIAFLTSAGLGMFFSAMNVKYRDVRHALPFFIQSLLFVTPVIYPVSILGEKFRWLFALNPMSGVIETVRAGLLNTKPIDFILLGISLAMSIILFLLGLLYFKKTERFFADIA